MSESVLSEMEESAAVIRKLEAEVKSIVAVGREFARVLRNDGAIFVFGNGGSAADAQHLVAELVGRLDRVRRPFSAFALTTNTSILTAVANDFAFDEVFSRQVLASVRSRDLVVGISTSGGSRNVIKGVEAAKERGAKTVGLTGAKGSELARVVDLSIVVPSANTQRIQEAHALITHIICRLVEDDLARKTAKS